MPSVPHPKVSKSWLRPLLFTLALGLIVGSVPVESLARSRRAARRARRAKRKALRAKRRAERRARRAARRAARARKKAEARARLAKKRAEARAKKKALKLFAAGKELYKQEDFSGAAKLFLKAYKIWPRRNIMLNVAICYAEQNNPLQATRYLRRALGGDTRTATELLDSAEYAKLLSVRKQVSVLVVRGWTAETDIMLGTRKIGRGSIDIVLAPGSYLVAMRGDGKQKIKRFVLEPGGTVRWDKGPKGGSGPIRIVTIRGKGGKRASVAGTENGKTSGKRKKLSPVIFIAVASAAVLAGAVTIGLGVKTQQLGRDFAATGDESVRRSGVRYKTGTNVMIGITVSAAVAAGALAFFTDWKRLKKRRERAKARVLPYFAPGGRGGGLSVLGRF